LKARIRGVMRDPRVLRIAKFGLASGIGFLVAEGILVIGVAGYFGSLAVSDPAQSAPAVLALDVLAFGIGVTVAFVINERVTFGSGGKGAAGGREHLAVRWFKYQAASFLGNVVIVVVQLALLAAISLTPALGSVVGAIVSYPFTYAVSVRYVWRASPPPG
jgi:putative flippase GtrA